MYVSDYVIFGKNKDDDYILIHSYLGNVDILEKKYADILVKCKEKNTKVNEGILPQEIYAQLKRKGYIVENKSYDKERYLKIANKLKEISVKKSINYTIIPSYECNFRCSYCFELESVGKTTNNKIMPKKNVDYIFNDIDKKISDKKKISIILFGGEPLLVQNKEINEYIVKNAEKRNLKVSAISNGYELDNYIDIFAKGNFDSIQVTLDGDEEVHDSRRYRVGKKPTFKKIIENIDKVLKVEKGPEITVRINVDKNNFNSVKNLFELFKEKKWIENKKFSFYTKSVHACYAKPSEKVYDSDVIDNVKVFNDTLENMKCNIQYRRMISDIKSIFSTKNKLGTLRTSACGAVNGMQVIDAYGYIYACYEEVDTKENAIGYINPDTGEFIYNTKRKIWLNRHVQNIDECSKCSYSLICAGGCPQHTKVETGSLYNACCCDEKEIFNRVLLELAPTMED